ncbi:uncharacterized protein [Diabrotica undecimpunctata]|uniref:uncharacterized protein isoform X2 n=1 Tax=Diabrotica undecimpunctata TaxID=50387 RepID=UPI003B641755
MILIKILYLWTNILQITVSLSPATLFACMQLQGIQAKAVASALNWKLKSKFNSALGKPAYHNIFTDKNYFGQRFVRDVGMTSRFLSDDTDHHLNQERIEEQNSFDDEDGSSRSAEMDSYEMEYYGDEYPLPYNGVSGSNMYHQNHRVPCNAYLPEVYDNGPKEKPRQKPNLFHHHIDSQIPGFKGLFPHQFLPRTLDVDEESDDFNQHLVFEPVDGAHEAHSLGTDGNGERVGTIHLLPFTPLNPDEPAVPYQNPRFFNPLKAENRQKVIHLIEQEEDFLKLILEKLDRVAYKFADPFTPKPLPEKPPKVYSDYQDSYKNYKPTEDYSQQYSKPLPEKLPTSNYDYQNSYKQYKTDKPSSDYSQYYPDPATAESTTYSYSEAHHYNSLIEDIVKRLLDLEKQKLDDITHKFIHPHFVPYKDVKYPNKLNYKEELLDIKEDGLKSLISMEKRKLEDIADIFLAPFTQPLPGKAPSPHPEYPKEYRSNDKVHDKGEETNITPTVNSNTLPDQQDVLPTVYPIYDEKQNSDKVDTQNLQPAGSLPTDNPETEKNLGPLPPSATVQLLPKEDTSNPHPPEQSKIEQNDDINPPASQVPNQENLFKSELQRVDQGAKDVINEAPAVYNALNPVNNLDRYSQLIADEIEKLREATRKESGSDDKLRETYHEEDRLSEGAPSELDDNWSSLPQDSYTENNPRLGHIITVPNNYDYHRRTRNVAQNLTADEYLNIFLNEGKQMLKNVQKLGAGNDDVLLLGYLGNIIMENIQKRLNVSSINNTHSNSSNVRRKRNVPVETLLTDPKLRVDVPKVLENLGTFAKTLLDHKDTPIYHIRNIVGSAKDVALATIKIPNQNFIVPSGYNIVDNPNKGDTILESAYPDISSRFGDESDGGQDWPQELVQNTFQNVGHVIRNAVRSGQEAIHHVGEITNHAKKAILTARQAPEILMHTVSPIPVTSDEKVSLNSRFGDEDDNPIVGQTQQIPEFVKMGHLLDAAGVSNPAITPEAIDPRTNTQNNYLEQFWKNIGNLAGNHNLKNIQDSFNKKTNIEKIIQNKHIFPKYNIQNNKGYELGNIQNKVNDKVKNVMKNFEEYAHNKNEDVFRHNAATDNIQNKNPIKSIKELFPGHSNLPIQEYQENIQKFVNNNFQQTFKNLESIGSNQKKDMTVRNNFNFQNNKYMEDLKENVENTINSFNNVENKSTKKVPKEKTEYVQQVLDKIEDVLNNANSRKSIQNVSNNGEKERRDQIQKLRNKLDNIHMMHKLTSRNNREKNLQNILDKIDDEKNRDKFLKNLKNGVEDLKKTLGVENIRDFVGDVKEKLNDLRENNALDVKNINFINKRTKRDVKDTPTDHEDIVQSSFIPTELTHPFFLPGLTNLNEDFDQSDHHNPFFMNMQDLEDEREALLERFDQRGNFLSTDLNLGPRHSDHQHLLGPVLGASTPDMFEQTFHEHFTNKGIHTTPQEAFQRPQNTDKDDVVSTSMTMHKSLLKPFLGKGQIEEMETVNGQYGPVVSCGCCGNQISEHDIYY